jgi:hypothetical protein
LWHFQYLAFSLCHLQHDIEILSQTVRIVSAAAGGAAVEEGVRAMMESFGFSLQKNTLQ